MDYHAIFFFFNSKTENEKEQRNKKKQTKSRFNLLVTESLRSDSEVVFVK